MGLRGTAPTPTKILEARGSWRAKLNPSEPQPPRGRPKCPRWMCPTAKRAWKRLVRILDVMGVMTHADKNALIRYCELWAAWRTAMEWVDRYGEVRMVKNDRGEPTGEIEAWPQMKMICDLSTQLSKLEGQFGLTPSARTRLTATPRSEKDADVIKDKSRFIRLG